MKISVVIPMYNEESIVENAVKVLDTALLKSFGQGNYEMLFVSDGSLDSCLEIVKGMTDSYPALRALGYEKNQGKGCAVRTGMLEACGDFVLFTDCDLAYGAEIIERFYSKFTNSGCDIVIGSRALKGGGYDGYSFMRKIMSKAYLKVVSVYAGFKLSDSQCGIKGFSNKAAKDIFSKCLSNGFEFDLEAIMLGQKAGYEVCEIPVRIINHRESKVSPIRDSLKMLRRISDIKKRMR